MSAPNQEQLYYCSISGNESGPFNAEQLKQLVKEGHLRGTDSVRREQSMTWHTAVDIKGLFSDTVYSPLDSGSAITPPPVQPPKQTDSGVNSRPGQTKPEEYFYYDNKTAERKGPYNQWELKALAEKRMVKKDTILETPDGKTAEAGNVAWIWEDMKQQKIGEVLPNIPLLERIPIQKIAAAVLVLVAVIAAVFAFQWLFSGGSGDDIDKPTSGLIAKAEKGNPKACVQLIDYYVEGRGYRIKDHKDLQAAGEKIRKYVKKGAKGDDSNPYTQICKGYAYLMDDAIGDPDDPDVKDNLERALKAFYKAAEAGNSEGAVVFATHIEGVLERYANFHRDDLSEYARRNKEQAGEWLVKAAERGHTRAQYQLGVYSADSAGGNKIGILKDDQEAIKWIYKAAAKRNTLKNNLALGFAALLEDVSQRDAKRAFSLLYKRANGGWLDLIYKRKPAKEELPNLAVLQCFIAHYYDEGIGGAKENKAKAFEWYKKAAETNAIELIANDAQFHIAQAYDSGEGVSEDKAAAFKQYKKAADAGHILAQYRVAKMYDEGEGVKEDRDEAKVWYRKVCDNWREASLFGDKRLHLAVLNNIKTFRNKVKEEEQRIQLARENSEKKSR